MLLMLMDKWNIEFINLVFFFCSGLICFSINFVSNNSTFPENFQDKANYKSYRDPNLIY